MFSLIGFLVDEFLRKVAEAEAFSWNQQHNWNQLQELKLYRKINCAAVETV